jgi:hypothetical protein
MNRRIVAPLSRALPALLAAALAATAAAQTSTSTTSSTDPLFLDVTAGYRAWDVSGNKDMYRSQIDERPGILFRDVSLAVTDSGGGGLFDHVTVNASDLGVGPVGGFRVDAGRSGLYRLRATFRHADMFSALPGFANPLYGQGIIPGQHTYDRTRNTFDADLEILPGKIITPIIGYSRNTYSGPGTWTYHVGADEFRLSQSLFDTDQEARVGASFAAGPVSGQVIQGWRKFSQDENLRLGAGEFTGNNLAPVLGVPVNLTSFFRHTETDVNTPATSAFVIARFMPGVRLIAHYDRARGSSSTEESEDLTGNLVSFEISRFFQGFSDTISAHARATQWNGGGRVEIGVLEFVDFEAGFERRHRERDGFALISELFANTTLFSGLNPGDVTELISADTKLDRTEDLYETKVVFRGLGPLSLRGGYSQLNQDLTVTPDPSEIVVPGGQGGTFERSIKTYDVGANLTVSGLTFGADYRNERADTEVVRTDFRKRDRYRLRLVYEVRNVFRIAGTAQQLDIHNDDFGIGLDGRMRQYGGELDVTPAKPVRLRFAADKYQAENSIPIRRPQDFSVVQSIHVENGTSWEGSLGIALARVDLEAGYAWFGNTGVFPFTINRAHVRAEVPFAKNFSAIAEFKKDKYIERATDQPNLGYFDANRYGFFLRWHM